MTLKQMRYFVSICKTQNLTKSAQELFVSQPTLSVAMKELENEVGTPLFHKKGTRNFLTEAGRTLFEEVSSILTQYERMESLVRSGNLSRNYVRFGFSTVVGASAAPKICNRFLKDNPELQIHIVEDYGNHLLQQLEDDQLDIVLTGEKYEKTEQWAGKFQSFAFPFSCLGFCIARKSPLASKKTITMEEIAKTPVIMLNEGSPISQNTEQIFRDSGHPLNVILRTSQIYTAEQFVAAGVAGGFLPQESCAEHADIVYLHCPELDTIQRPAIKLYWKKTSTYVAPLLKFIQSAKQSRSASEGSNGKKTTVS